MNDQEKKISIVNKVVRDLIEGIQLLGNVAIEEISNPIHVIHSPPSEKPKQKCRILTSVHSGVYPEQIGIIIRRVDEWAGYAVEVEQEYINQCGGSNKTRKTTLFFNESEIELLT